jgi:hypothetical protein
MDYEKFTGSIAEIMSLPSPQRHQQLANFHTLAYTAYLAALQAISSEQATALVNIGKDTRTLAQVVGHIAAWDRFAIQSAGDLLAGIEHPRMIATVENFIERDGTLISFQNVDEFNAYHAQQQVGWDWVASQLEAIDAATVLHALFTQPNLLTFERLDRAKPQRRRLENGALIETSTMGWNLWLTALQHYAVEHAAELGLELVG